MQAALVSDKEKAYNMAYQKERMIPMAKRQHAKSKDPRAAEIMRLIKATASREPMPRPCRFTPKTVYNRKRLPRPMSDGSW